MEIQTISNKWEWTGDQKEEERRESKEDGGETL